MWRHCLGGEFVKISDSSPPLPPEIQKQQGEAEFASCFGKGGLRPSLEKCSFTNDERESLGESPACWALVSWCQLRGKALSTCNLPPTHTHNSSALPALPSPGAPHPHPGAEEQGLQHWKVEAWHLPASVQCLGKSWLRQERVIARKPHLSQVVRENNWQLEPRRGERYCQTKARQEMLLSRWQVDQGSTMDDGASRARGMRFTLLFLPIWHSFFQ